MKYNLGRKGIFVFSDAAGANSVLALVDNLIQEGFVVGEDFLIFTNSIGIYPTEYEGIVKRVDFDSKYFEKIIDSFCPNYLFSGTSLNDYDHKWRKLAINKGMKTYAFIDHWGNYLKRFTFENETIFPDEIWVINEIAKKEAIADGIPSKMLIVSSNPYYGKVKKFVPQITKEEFFDLINLPKDKKVILFVCDNLRESFAKDENGKYILGYDEYSVLEDILESFYELNKSKLVDFSKYIFIIKLHPRSNANKFDYLFKNEKYKFLNIFVKQKIDPLLINYFSDYVLGMFSNMIIESLLIGKKVLRVQAGQIGNDYLKFNEIKSEIVINKNELTNEIYELLGCH
ncbi:TPA: hypothetical protein DEO28_05055 [Candidatus Dependentiae bacterium]|nr:MAG: hypothetical protein UR14_C0002G0124 [candidate division TM6 bacterium GW2011_GWE2_31_21]KKP53921.1 MAG: hypothetical protein UR43_C0002G0124 [candidate division TM6 bacterium GW2011_GWF2_33_332]HBS47701.1 hypothetical protein [Candidatus Dependentiae bacterium]HBZ73850.1 hypothetical protein [Candidatus Dependentiae bacterium]